MLARLAAAAFLVLGAATAWAQGPETSSVAPALPPAQQTQTEGECVPGPSSAVLAELSTHEVDVSSDFTGTMLIVFGAIDCPGDVLVAVRGPRRLTVVRQKVQVAGIWVNGSGVTFEDAPSLYGVASTAPLDQTLPRVMRAALGIGLDELRLSMREDGRPGWGDYREALIRYNQRRQLYTRAPVQVQMTGDRLFRAHLWLPSTVSVGNYTAEVYYVRNGNIAGTVQLPFTVGKVGFDARVFEFAEQRPALYGLVAIIVTALTGWLVGVLFRRS